MRDPQDPWIRASRNHPANRLAGPGTSFRGPRQNCCEFRDAFRQRSRLSAMTGRCFRPRIDYAARTKDDPKSGLASPYHTANVSRIALGHIAANFCNQTLPKGYFYKKDSLRSPQLAHFCISRKSTIITDILIVVAVFCQNFGGALYFNQRVAYFR